MYSSFLPPDSIPKGSSVVPFGLWPIFLGIIIYCPKRNYIGASGYTFVMEIGTRNRQIVGSGFTGSSAAGNRSPQHTLGVPMGTNGPQRGQS